MSIKELREAVEAGTFMPDGHVLYPKDFPNIFDEKPARNATYAYLGSLSGAKRLNDAMLPAHRAILDFVLMEVTMFRPCHDDAGKSTDEWDMVGDEVKALDGNMARAWLIAILKALEEEGRG